MYEQKELKQSPIPPTTEVRGHSREETMKNIAERMKSFGREATFEVWKLSLNQTPIRTVDELADTLRHGNWPSVNVNTLSNSFNRAHESVRQAMGLLSVNPW